MKVYILSTSFLGISSKLLKSHFLAYGKRLNFFLTPSENPAIYRGDNIDAHVKSAFYIDSGICGFRDYSLLSVVSPMGITPKPELFDFYRSRQH